MYSERGACFKLGAVVHRVHVHYGVDCTLLLQMENYNTKCEISPTVDNSVVSTARIDRHGTVPFSHRRLRALLRAFLHHRALRKPRTSAPQRRLDE